MSHFFRTTEINWEMKVTGREGHRPEQPRELSPGAGKTQVPAPSLLGCAMEKHRLP